MAVDDDRKMDYYYYYYMIYIAPSMLQIYAHIYDSRTCEMLCE